MTKYLEEGNRGAVFFDINRPSGLSKEFSTYNWASMEFAKATRDRQFQELIKG